MTRIGCAVIAAAGLLAPARAADMHAPFDKILDVYVRDGYVYYKALQQERRALDQYVAALDVPAAQVAAVVVERLRPATSMRSSPAPKDWRRAASSSKFTASSATARKAKAPRTPSRTSANVPSSWCIS